MNFWALLERLPDSSIRMSSDLQDTEEIRSMFPDCSVGLAGLLEHPCMWRGAERDKMERMGLIMKRLVSICRHHAGFTDGPKALGILLGRYGWVHWGGGDTVEQL